MKTKVISKIIMMIMTASVLYSCYYDDVVTFDGLPQNVSFKNDVAPILSQNCTTSGCHDAVPSHEPSLVTENAYSSLSTGSYINVLDPEDSKLYQEIASGNMPPSGALDVNDQKIILAWITEGAKDN